MFALRQTNSDLLNEQLSAGQRNCNDRLMSKKETIKAFSAW